jgi:aromatic-L-amino-acid decarboxylase
VNPIDISPEQFETLARKILAIATEYLRDLDRRTIPPSGGGAEIEARYHSPLPETGLPEQAIARLSDVVRDSRAQNGRFFGYVLGSGEPAAAAAELLCSVLNQNATAWRSSPAAATLEKTVVGWLAQSIGCEGFRGSLTGGGSAANLMSLAMSREAKAPANQKGFRPGNSPVVYASSEVHMSIPKAIALLGIGRENLRLVPVDECYRMIPAKLEQVMQDDTQHGVTPIAVVATAGTVNTGAIDPLSDIAQIAARYGAWFHIDGSYGALGAIAEPEKFRGMALADSISLDPHKWLYQPIDCGCLLYRESSAARRAFAQSDEYVRPLSADPIEGYAFFDESIELSRRFRALKLWFSLQYHGFSAFRKAIEKDLEHAQRLGDSIRANPELNLMAPIELSAVCFRYVGSGTLTEDELNRLNAELLKRLILRGRVYLSNATLQSKFCLRACVVNHRTTDADIDSVVSEVVAAAREVQ